VIKFDVETGKPMSF